MKRKEKIVRVAVKSGNYLFGIIVVIEFLLYVPPGNSQTWVQQVSTTTNNLNGVFFLNDSVGVVVGDKGTILKTTDEGAHWQFMMNGIDTTGLLLNSVWFINNDTGYVVGENIGGGVIYRTSNGGNDWWLQLYVNKKLHCVYFSTGSNGVIVGDSGQIIHTMDSGNIWASMVFGWLGENLYSVAFQDSVHGVAVGLNGVVASTFDGGANWPQTSITYPVLDTLLSVSFSSFNTGYAVGTSSNITTHDGGLTWQQTSLAASMNYAISIRSDSNIATCVGEQGKIYRTTDRGNSWNLETSNVTDELRSAFFTDTGNGTAVGKNGTILRRRKNAGGEPDSISFILPTMEIPLGQVGYVPITVKPSWQDNSFKDYEVEISFDSSVVYVHDIISSGTRSEGANLTFTRRNRGRINIRASKQTGFVGSDTLIIIAMEAILGSNNKSDLIFNKSSAAGFGQNISSRNGSIAESGCNSGIGVHLSIAAMEQNFPNPVGNETLLKFSLASEMNIDLSLFDVFGNKVKTLRSGMHAQGNYTLHVLSGDLPDGFYICKLRTPFTTISKKISIVH